MVSDPVYWVSFTQSIEPKKAENIFRFNTYTFTVKENNTKSVSDLKSLLIDRAKQSLTGWYISHGYKSKTKKNNEDLTFTDKSVTVIVKNFKVKKVESQF